MRWWASRTIRRRWGCLVAVIVASACANHKAAAIQYAAAHASSLVTTTRPLWTTSRATGKEITESKYTADIRALHPNGVVAGPQGMWIYVYSSYANVTGIFVRYDPAFPTPPPAQHDPVDMGFVRLATDVYWFSVPR